MLRSFRCRRGNFIQRFFLLVGFRVEKFFADLTQTVKLRQFTVLLVNCLVRIHAVVVDHFSGLVGIFQRDALDLVEDATGEAPTEEDYTETQRDFSDAVNGLSEPLSEVAGTVLHG